MIRHTRLTMALVLLAIVVIVATAATAARADEPRLARQGVFAGLDFGAGGSGFQYTKAGVKHESEEDTGSAVTLRLGYAFNPYFSLSVDGRGYHHHDDDFDYTVRTSTIMATVYPLGGGFFFRVGAGGAVIETEVPDDSDDPAIEEFDQEGGALALGVGYDWLVNEHLAVGLSLDARGAAVDDFDGFSEVAAAETTLGFSANYYF